MDDHRHHQHGPAGDRGAAASALDPVCGMTVDPATALSAEVGGKTYYFCSEGCRTKFVADPKRYLEAKPLELPAKSHGVHGHEHGGHERHGHGQSGAGRSHPPASPVPPPDKREGEATAGAVQYTCPMHPEIVRDAPGSCPICGMALEPMVARLDDGPNPELKDFTRRLIVSAALSVPILVLSMGELIGLRFRDWWGAGVVNWMELALTSPVVVWAALPFFHRFWNSLRNRSPNMWTLIGLGVGVAYLASVLAVIAPGLFPMSDMGPPVYFESASVIVALVFVGQVLELRAREATGHAIRALLKDADEIVIDGNGA